MRMHDECASLAPAMVLLLAPVGSEAKDVYRTRLGALVAKADARDLGANQRVGKAIDSRRRQCAG